MPCGRARNESRTIVVNPTERVRLGGHRYRESLPLRDREVVLTFDERPGHHPTPHGFSSCWRPMREGDLLHGRPHGARLSLARAPRPYNERGDPSPMVQPEPSLHFPQMSGGSGLQEIEDGLASLRTVLGDPKAVAPFLRIPGLLRQEPVEQYLCLARLHDLERRFPGRRLDPYQEPRRSRGRHRAGWKPRVVASCFCTTSSPPPRFALPTHAAATSRHAASRSCACSRPRRDSPNG